MTTQKKNTIKIATGGCDLSTKAEMCQWLTDHPTAFFVKECSENGNVYRLSTSNNKSAIASNALLAEVSRRFETNMVFHTPSDKVTGTLSTENFDLTWAEIVEAITLAEGNNDWVNAYIAKLESSGQLSYSTDLLTSLVKLHHRGEKNATAEDKSEIISKYIRNELNLTEDLVKLRKASSAASVLNVMEGMKLVYFVQGPAGGFTARSKDKGTQAHYSGIPVTIETIGSQGVPEKITACTVTFTNPSDATEKRLNRKRLVASPPLEYVRCEPNGQVTSRQQRVIYSESKDLLARKSKAKTTAPAGAITVEVKGVKKTRKAVQKDTAAVAEAEADAQRVYSIVYSIVRKHDSSFMDKLFKSGKKCDPFVEVAKAFDALNPAYRGGMVYAKLTKNDIEALEKLSH